MSAWKAKRFWKEVSVADAGRRFWHSAGCASGADTGAKALMVVPTRAMAEAIADEWRAVEKEIDPRRMPVTRAANAAIDKVDPPVRRGGGSDCGLRGVRPVVLPGCWRRDELVACAGRRPGIRCSTGPERMFHGARLKVTTRGVAPVGQPQASASERLSTRGAGLRRPSS